MRGRIGGASAASSSAWTSRPLRVSCQSARASPEERQLLGLEVGEVLLDLVRVDGRDVSQHVHLGEALDAQGMKDTEAGLGVVRHSRPNGTSAALAALDHLGPGPGDPTRGRGSGDRARRGTGWWSVSERGGSDGDGIRVLERGRRTDRAPTPRS